MKDAARRFLSSDKTKKHFQHLINAAMRHLGPEPPLLRKLNVITTAIQTRIVIVHYGGDVPPLFVVHQRSESFVITVDSKLPAPSDSDSLQAQLRSVKSEDTPTTIVDPPSLMWASSTMELILSEIDRFPSLYEDGQVDESYRRKCVRCLLRLSRKYSRLPPSFFLYDAAKNGQHSVDGGGFADIWMGSLDGSPVCMKVLRYYTSLADEKLEQLVKTFCREALCWGRMNHPNILPFLGVDEQTFRPSFCLISPWMENGNLMSFLKKAPHFNRYKAITDTAQGMRYLHELDPPIVHADIRGANILVKGDLSCCLADFGLSAATEMTITSVRREGTVAWMAPEALREVIPPIGPSTERDIYAFGCTMFEIITGQRPFNDLPTPFIVRKVTEGERPPRPQLEEIPNDKWALINACWDHEPNNRPRSRQVLLALGVPPSPNYTILCRPDSDQNGESLYRKLRSDKEYLLQLMPRNEEKPSK
ncbi:kinase-like domain-containing protein, partial [Mycena crocata]